MTLSTAMICAAATALGAATVPGSSTSPATQPGSGVEFYLLADRQMDFQTARTRPLADLVLQTEPWITAWDIERYDWSSHYVYLKRPVEVPLPEGRKYVLLRGTPFVVVADGQRCYLGALWTPISSFAPESTVAMVNVWRTQFDRFEITLHSFLRPGKTPTDVRADKRVLKALQAQGLYHAGLQCSLDAVRVEQNDDSTAIIYTYTLRNLDEDALYVMDPQRMTPALFHYFQNGVYGSDVDDGTVLPQPKPRKADFRPPPVGKLDMTWFTRLKKGEKMTRTVPMDVVDEVLPGKYECQFTYGLGEFMNLKREQLQLPDGRLWLGHVRGSLTVELPGK